MLYLADFTLVSSDSNAAPASSHFLHIHTAEEEELEREGRRESGGERYQSPHPTPSTRDLFRVKSNGERVKRGELMNVARVGGKERQGVDWRRRTESKVMRVREEDDRGGGWVMEGWWWWVMGEGE